jgi:hypothetical protein
MGVIICCFGNIVSVLSGVTAADKDVNSPNKLCFIINLELPIFNRCQSLSTLSIIKHPFMTPSPDKIVVSHRIDAFIHIYVNLPWLW